MFHRHLKILGPLVFLAVLCLAVVSCTPQKTTTTPPPPTLSSIAVTPASPGELAVGGTQQFTATGTYSDGTNSVITSQVSWASSNITVASISSSGLATALAAGSAGITAALSGKTSPAVALTVAAAEPAVTSINITGVSGNLTAGDTAQLTAVGIYSDNSSQDITSRVTWATSDNAVATISQTGLLTAVAAGNADITATLSTVSGDITVNVVAAPALESITITPASPDTLAVGATIQLAAAGTYSDASSADISSQVTWASSADGVATVSASGLVTAVAAGTANITASLSGITAAPVTVTVQ